jgi:outer membrane murein-binding lipoprotein Lpp
LKRTATSSLLALLVGGALLAGCGSSSKSDSTSAPAQSVSVQGAAAPSAATTPKGAAAVAACKQAIQAQTTLTSDEKKKLEGLCDKAANGNEAEIKAAAKAICEEVINKSAIPAGPAREQALQACKQH